MGRTPKPLRIYVHPSMVEWVEVQALAAQGHVVQALADPGDLILSPTAWKMDQDHRKYVNLAVSAARRQKYPKGDVT